MKKKHLACLFSVLLIIFFAVSCNKDATLDNSEETITEISTRESVAISPDTSDPTENYKDCLTHTDEEGNEVSFETIFGEKTEVSVKYVTNKRVSTVYPLVVNESIKTLLWVDSQEEFYLISRPERGDEIGGENNERDQTRLYERLFDIPANYLNNESAPSEINILLGEEFAVSREGDQIVITQQVSTVDTPDDIFAKPAPPAPCAYPDAYLDQIAVQLGYCVFCEATGAEPAYDEFEITRSDILRIVNSAAGNECICPQPPDCDAEFAPSIGSCYSCLIIQTLNNDESISKFARDAANEAWLGNSYSSLSDDDKDIVAHLIAINGCKLVDECELTGDDFVDDLLLSACINESILCFRETTLALQLLVLPTQSEYENLITYIEGVRDACCNRCTDYGLHCEFLDNWLIAVDQNSGNTVTTGEVYSMALWAKMIREEILARHILQFGKDLIVALDIAAFEYDLIVTLRWFKAVPAGYNSTAVRTMIRAMELTPVSPAFSSLIHAQKYGIQRFSKLVDIYKELGVTRTGTNTQFHHLIEQRFRNITGTSTVGNKTINSIAGGTNTNAWHSIVVAKDGLEHAPKFTTPWRQAIGTNGIGWTGASTATATVDDVILAAREIYKDYPEILLILGL